MMPEISVKRRAVDMVCPHAADLEVFGPRQGEESAERMAISVEVTLGEQDFIDEMAADGFGVTLSFSRVILALIPSKCEIEKAGRYERTIPAELFHKAINEQKNASTDIGGSASVGAGGEARVFAFLKLGASASADAAHTRQDARAVSIDTVARCAIVTALPQHRWEIGRFVTDELGAREGPLGVLRGSFFGQPSTGENGLGTDLCAVTATGSKGFIVTVELRARIADCVLTPLGPEAGGSETERLNKALIEQRLGIKMIEELNRKKGRPDPPPGEIIFARGVVEVKPKKRDSSGDRNG